MHISCADKPDIDSIDSLIHIGKYNEALNILNDGKDISGLKPVEKKRIQTRILKVERILFFQPLDNLIKRRNWEAAGEYADSLKKTIDKLDLERFEPYNFDFYYKKSIIDSNQLGTEVWCKGLKTALNFYTPEYEKEQHIHEQLAFYFAEKGEFTIAREHIDKSLRKLSISSMDPQLKEVFKLYMEGEFKLAYDNLKKVNNDIKNKHWLTTQLFLEKYGSSLTMEGRFKLW